MQKARHCLRSDTLFTNDCRFYFTLLKAVLFTFPSRYLFTIGYLLIFSLTPWSAQIHAKFHVYRVTQEGALYYNCIYRPLTFWRAFFHTLTTIAHKV